MEVSDIQRWSELFVAAEKISEVVLAEIHLVANRTLTPEENEQVLSVWEDNRDRAAHNAGLDEPPTSDAGDEPESPV